MERAKAALRAIKREPDKAEAILRDALADDLAGVTSGLAVFVAAALQGWILGPDDL